MSLSLASPCSLYEKAPPTAVHPNRTLPSSNAGVRSCMNSSPLAFLPQLHPQFPSDSLNLIFCVSV